MSSWRKPFVTVAGGTLVTAGLFMLVLPGPGLLTIAAGLAVWAKEYEWAERLLAGVRRRIGRKKEE